MYRVLFTIFLLIIVPVAVFSADNAAMTYKVIGDNQTWQGKIEVSQPILVAAGVRLDVSPGTEIVILNKQAVIRVEGNLQAVGTKEQPITFVAPDGWVGIELFQAQDLNLFEQVQISHASFAISTYLSKLEIRNSRFEKCQTAIKLHRQSSLEISGTQFNKNQVAVDIGTRSQVEIISSRFVANNTAVIASHNSSGSVSENVFSENQQAIYLQHVFPGQISNNQFEDNVTAIHCDQTMNSPTITENSFTGNDKAVVSFMSSKPTLVLNHFMGNDIALFNNQLGSPKVSQNFFVSNQIAIKNERRSAPLIENNQFEENHLALLCDYLSYPKVKRNNFVANKVAVKLGDHQSAEMEKQGTSKEQMEKFIAESGSQGKLAVFPPSSGIVDVSMNWWGDDLSQSASQIFYARSQEKWVLDETTGERYLRDQITYTPWLQQPVVNAGIQ